MELLGKFYLNTPKFQIKFSGGINFILFLKALVISIFILKKVKILKLHQVEVHLKQDKTFSELKNSSGRMKKPQQVEFVSSAQIFLNSVEIICPKGIKV